jgi:hypothetical protein
MVQHWSGHPSEDPGDPGALPRATPPAASSATLRSVLTSAARLQQLVPDAVLVGGSAAALYAGHRESYDHDHVLEDLAERFDAVLDALEREPDWVTNRVTPGKIILGSLGDIEAGVRQMIRRRPLEFEEVEVAPGVVVRVPTLPEILRVKAFLIIRRNQVRDYLDVAALSASLGVEAAGGVLAAIDDFYSDPDGTEERVASQLVRQLGNPRPKDRRTLDQLKRYKGIRPPWDDWDAIRSTCVDVAAHMELAGLESAAGDEGRGDGG